MDNLSEDDDYFDTISVTSGSSRKRLSNNNQYIALSRNTVYHSAFDLGDGTMEMTEFSDGVNKRWRCFSGSDLVVDFVMAYCDQGRDDHATKRKIFERNLEKTGLILEREENQRIHFVKINVPHELLCQYAEILKLRLPIKDHDEPLPKDNFLQSGLHRLLKNCGVTLDEHKFPLKKYQLTAEFSKDKPYLFDMEAPQFFNSSVRITVISYILEREKFGSEDQDKGIRRLVSEGVYKGAYPLHDGDYSEPGSCRNLLFKEWAQVSKWIKYQPIDEIKDYFGVKFALYFTWLGFYTHMLIPASVVGVLCLIHAWTTLDDSTTVADICNLDITMCPLCDKYCDYWKLSESCTYSKIQHFVDNPATIFFAVFMSVWGAIYLELWKRYSAEVTHRWGLTGFDLQAEPPRPEYFLRLSNAKRRKLNVVTQLQEPVVPFWRVKLPSIILSFTVALFWVFIALGVVVGVVIYRMSLLTSDTLYNDRSSFRIYVVPVTAGVINLVCIVVLNMAYDRLAVWLTEMELQRTQTEFDDSLALKIYMFQFVNYYSSIFYIAFFKGKFVGYPSKYNKVFGYRQEECNPGGCLMELTMQLAIIMIGKQAVNTILEMIIPLLFKMYQTFVVTTGIERAEKEEELIVSCNQWTEDYKLSELESQSLFAEYLEMVLQYGFVTIFVAAFPLAPLFALINNVLEMRLDAKKFIKYYRRPVPQRVRNIGVWYPILAIVGRIAVVSNALIIAFSSHFIPKLVYALKVNPTARNDAGFLDFSLAYFNTSDFKTGTAPETTSYNVSVCRYAEYRNPPDHEYKYKRPLIYWHILAARLAFIVVYQNLVGFVMTVVEWTIPDVSRKLNDRIKREAYKVNEIIIKNETERARQRAKKTRRRDSLLSGNASIYHDAQSDAGDPRSNRSTIYYDSGNS
ncbi:anoctamin-1-like isoform X2 [Cylas formicarius]|uniref:anoctamin-1-like isoform X2 n=1 Tax=Cylas formicarius TaxID=197179 RepID=UPI002958A3C2|nr:anoctamin-1-like isoform X2 [Cylas formicarius]